MHYRRLFNIAILLLIIVGSIGIVGCGELEALDESGDAYSAALSFSDVTGDNLEFIDTVRTLDCDGDGIADDPEDFGPLSGNLTVTIRSDVNGLQLVRYNIEITPVPTETVSGTGLITPIDLEDSSGSGAGTDYFPSGSSLTIAIPVMPTQVKTQFLNWWLLAPQSTELEQTRYNIAITFIFEDDFGVEREETFINEVLLGSVDNC